MSDAEDDHWREIQEYLAIDEVPDEAELTAEPLLNPRKNKEIKKARPPRATKAAATKSKGKQSTLAQPAFSDAEFNKQIQKYRQNDSKTEEELDIQKYLDDEDDEEDRESEHGDLPRLSAELLGGDSSPHTADSWNTGGVSAETIPTPIEEPKIGLTDEAFSFDRKSERPAPVTKKVAGAGYRKEESKTTELQVTDALYEPTNGPPEALPAQDLFYWLDAKEQPHSSSVDAGSVFLFGKMSSDGKTYQSCCLRVRNVERVMFFLPREGSADRDVIGELNELCRQYRIDQRRMKFVERFYGFEDETIPHEKARWVKLRYSGRFPPFWGKGPWNHLQTVMGSTSSLLELFLIKRKLKGPCFLRVSDMTPATSKISHCALEFTVENPKLVRVEGGSLPAPPLTLASLQLHTQLDSKGLENEILLASVAVYKTVLIDATLPSKPTEMFTGVRPHSPDTVLPVDLEKYCEKRRFNVRCFPNERGLLLWLARLIREIDPDMLVGHNFVGFTLLTLLRRYQELSVPEWSSLGRLDLKRFPRLQSGTTATSQEREVCCGRLIVDSYVLAREYFKSTNYKLLSLSQEMGVEGLASGSASFEPGVTRLSSENAATSPQFFPVILQLCNAAVLAMSLSSHLDVIRLTKRLTSIAGNLWSRTLYGARSERIEYLLLHAFHDLKFITPDKRTLESHKRSREESDVLDGAEEADDTKRRAKYQGGMVLDPRCGHYSDYILLLDFNSLYPSLIQEFSICFTTVERWGDVEVDVPAPERLICNSCMAAGLPSPCIHRCVLPRVIKSLVDQRREVKRLMQRERDPNQLSLLDTRQKALKLTANSMYGCLGFEFSRFFAQSLAELVTRQGRLALQNAVEMVPQLNPSLRVLYGDTDSVMIQTGIKSDLETVRQIGMSLKAAINKKYQSLEIDIDGVFRSILLLKKKKYAALAVVDWQGEGKSYKKEVKGLDMVRRDWCPLSKKVCDAVLNRILMAENSDDMLDFIMNYMRTVARTVREGGYALEDFVISKSLTKEPEAYKGNGFPHAAVAKRMKARKDLVRVGDLIPYIICLTTGGEDHEGDRSSVAERAFHVDEVRQQTKLAVDSEWYLASQLYPPVMRLCEHIQGFTALQLSEVMEVRVGGGGGGVGAAAGPETNTDFTHWSFFKQCPLQECFPSALPLQITCPSCHIQNPVDPHQRVEAAVRLSSVAGQLSKFDLYVCPHCSKSLDVNYVANCLAQRCHALIKEFYLSGGPIEAVRALRTQFTYFRALFDFPRSPGCRPDVLYAHRSLALLCVAAGSPERFTREEAAQDEALDAEDPQKRFIVDPVFLCMESYYNRIEHLFISLDKLFA